MNDGDPEPKAGPGIRLRFLTNGTHRNDTLANEQQVSIKIKMGSFGESVIFVTWKKAFLMESG